MPVPPNASFPSRGLAWTAGLGAAWVFVLVALGAFTTSIGAGMAFPDWPLSNGSFNPSGWLTDLAMFAEHSHRLSAGLMTAVTLVLFVWVRRAEQRRWLRRLAGWALAAVLLQALAGGLRVLLEHLRVEMVGTSVGRLFAMAHACLAQVYVCLLLALAAGLSRRWSTAPAVSFRPDTRCWARWCCAALLLQLGVAAVMRHSGAGLAIPTAPWSTPDGALLPASWDFRIGIQFTHRILALALAVLLAVFVTKLWRDPAAGRGVRTLGLMVGALLCLQIGLGIEAVRTVRDPETTTAHVLVGAATLAATFLLSLLSHRAELEQHGAPAGRPWRAPSLAAASP